jgi:hypothetical protein
MSELDESLWHVQLPCGAVRKMTASELDAAFNDGLIDADTPVLADGCYEWSTLRVVAGLDDDPLPESQPSMSPPPASMDMPSLAPMAAEIELGDLDEFRPRSRGKVSRLLAIAFVLGAVGFAGREGGFWIEAFKNGTTSFGAGVAAKRSPRTWEVSSATVNEVPPPSPPALDCANCPQNLSEAQKKALAEADQQRAAKKSRAAPPPKPRRKADPVFREGGERFDPLNSKL